MVALTLVLVQVAVLALQQRYGPRFFVPARFLPVKYNYERRIDGQELSLLRVGDHDTIDCVICMVTPLFLLFCFLSSSSSKRCVCIYMARWSWMWARATT